MGTPGNELFGESLMRRTFRKQQTKLIPRTANWLLHKNKTHNHYNLILKKAHYISMR